MRATLGLLTAVVAAALLLLLLLLPCTSLSLSALVFFFGNGLPGFGTQREGASGAGRKGKGVDFMQYEYRALFTHTRHEEKYDLILNMQRLLSLRNSVRRRMPAFQPSDHGSRPGRAGGHPLLLVDTHFTFLICDAVA
jgi:hypothetical protein